MTEDRKLAALFACEKFLRESKWNVHTGLMADFWLAAVEWADNNLDSPCSTTGLGGIKRPIINVSGKRKKYKK